ncbi:MAG: phasin family protein [Anaerolineales bacterium]|nr:phasin family protein [Anaerolineales bacterium]
MTEVNAVQENGQELVIAVNPRKLFLAGLGAVVLTQESLTKLVKVLAESGNKLIDRGEQVADARMQQRQARLDAAEAAVAAEQETLTEQATELQQVVVNRLDWIWHRANIPTATDFNELNDKLVTLNIRLDELSQDEEE